MTDTMRHRCRRSITVRVVGALGAAVLGAGLLGACGTASAAGGVSVSCSGGDCRATVSSAPVTVQETEVEHRRTTSTVSGKRTSTRTTTREDRFRVTAIGRGSAQVVGDAGAVTVPAGGTFVGDDGVVRLVSADGRTAVFTWRE